MTSRGVCFAVALIVGLVTRTAHSAASDITLHYAGYAWSGDAAAGATAYPYSSSIGFPVLQQALTARLGAVKSNRFTLSSELGNAKSGDSLAVAFVLTWENVAQEKIESTYKITADIRAEVLIFDFQSRQVVAAVPFGVERRDVLQRIPTKEDLIGEFREIYYGETHNIFDAFVSSLNAADVKPSYGAYTQLTKIDFDDNARSLFNSLSVNPTTVRTFLAGAFEASLSTNLSIPVLPFVAGEAIGGVMAARFANGDVFTLKLPSPDYPISLTLRGFKKVVVDSNEIETGLAFATFAHLTVGQPLREAPFLDANFKFAVTKTVPKTVATTDDWAAYQESMLALVEGLTREMNKPDDAWIRQWGDGPNIPPQLLAASQALARCR